MSAERVKGLTLEDLDLALIDQSCSLSTATAHSYDRSVICRGNMLGKLQARDTYSYPWFSTSHLLIVALVNRT